MEDDLGLKQANVYNMMSIFVEIGEPTRQGWKRIRLFFADYYNPDWKNYDQALLSMTEEAKEGSAQPIREPHDHEFFTFTEIAKLPLRTLDKVKDVKNALSQKLMEICDTLDISQEQKESLKKPGSLRLREKLSEKLASVYHDEKVLNSYSMHDDKEIVI